MKLPSEFFRITKGSRPRYQFYQPGFNMYNGCWLEGAWITLSKEEWESKKDTHQELYAGIKESAKKQNHRDEGVLPKDMTPAQRQAWGYYSGQSRFDCLREGAYSPISVEMSGNIIRASSVSWMRKNGYKIIERTRSYNRDTLQLDGYENIPEDLIFRTETHIDTVRMTIDSNKARSAGMFEACLKETVSEEEVIANGFMAMMAFGYLIELEESMIRSEWEKTRKNSKVDPYDDYERDKETYTQARAKAQKFFGDTFQKHYESSKESHNSCARENLKNSDHKLFCYVLPKFNENGTHEPWTSEDVPDPDYDPWGTKE
jgi:hypothetical protein